nr:MAG TPA: hypothetical protein [Caudoviricetes sp.]
MNKLELAHAFALRGIDMEVLSSNYSLDLLVAQSWKYADLMLAEDEKRKDKGLPMAIQQTFINGVEQPRYAPENFVIDWDGASERYNYWVMDKDGRCFWYEREPRRDNTEFYQNCNICLAPDFGYKGDWKQSLRKRPE